MIEVEILVPTADNAKQPFPSFHHEQFEAELTTLFGGWQRRPGVVSGQWLDAGTVYADDLLVYVVAVPGLLAAADPLARLVAVAKAHYAQLAVYVRYLGQSEIL
jgi:hypothetical protein